MHHFGIPRLTVSMMACKIAFQNCMVGMLFIGPFLNCSYDPDKWTDSRYVTFLETAEGEPKNVWLYNISADPEEIIDLSDRYPDVC